MVLATAVPHSAPIRLVVAARATACRGVSTLVATTVAMELAVSWKPLMYSKTSAMRTTERRSVSTAGSSGVLQHDLEGDHARVAAAVDDLLQDLEEVLDQEHLRPS